MQSTPPYGAGLYLHYLLWDLSGECQPAFFRLIHVMHCFYSLDDKQSLIYLQYSCIPV